MIVSMAETLSAVSVFVLASLRRTLARSEIDASNETPAGVAGEVARKCGSEAPRGHKTTAAAAANSVAIILRRFSR